MCKTLEPLRLFPTLEPFETGLLDVGNGHQMFYMRSGNPDGLPVVSLHGGPASGSSAHHVRFFDPALFHIVQFDQRGSGKSTPLGERAHNCTAELIADIERLRVLLDVDQWLVMGGSWGSALGLAYAAAHPAACSALLIRGVFLACQADLNWYFHGMRHFLPEAWTSFAQEVGLEADFKNDGDPSDTTRALIDAYSAKLERLDSEEAKSATAAFMRWEQALGGAMAQTVPAALDEVDPGSGQLPRITQAHVQKYRLQLHYMANGCFVGDAEILQCAGAVSESDVPVAIVHGRRDCICRPANAWQVWQALSARRSGSRSECRLRLIDNTGHDPFSNEMVDATMQAVLCYARSGSFDNWESRL